MMMDTPSGKGKWSAIKASRIFMVQRLFESTLIYQFTK